MKKIAGGAARGQRTRKVAGHPVWRDGAMTTALLSRITATVRLARQRGPGHAGLDGDHLDALEAIARAAPSLAGLVGRLVRAGMASGEAEALVVEGAFEAVVVGEATSPETLTAGAWRRARAALRHERRFAAHHVHAVLTADAAPEAAPREPSCGSEPILVWARRAGVLSLEETELLATTRIAGRSLASVAAARGIPLKALTATRRRAEARLRAALAHVRAET